MAAEMLYGRERPDEIKSIVLEFESGPIHGPEPQMVGCKRARSVPLGLLQYRCICLFAAARGPRCVSIQVRPHHLGHPIGEIEEQRFVSGADPECASRRLDCTERLQAEDGLRPLPSFAVGKLLARAEAVL